jgi:hypothetical protein
VDGAGAGVSGITGEAVKYRVTIVAEIDGDDWGFPVILEYDDMDLVVDTLSDDLPLLVSKAKWSIKPVGKAGKNVKD